MDHNVINIRSLGGSSESTKVILMTVHTPIGNKTQKMETGRGSFREGLFQLRNGGEFSVFDRFVDPGKILIHDPTSSEIEVPDLGISHLTFRQPDVQSAAAKVSYGIRFVHFFRKRRVGETRAIAHFFRLRWSTGIVAPSVTNDQYYRFFGHIDRVIE
jgi:hypothetical protein